MAWSRLFTRNIAISRIVVARQPKQFLNQFITQPRRCVTIYHSKDNLKPPSSVGGEGGNSMGKQPLEDEKYLADLQRGVQQAHKEGDYEEALKLAVHAQKEMQDYFGVDHPVNAAAWNNIAIMNKKLGNYDAGIDAYLKAIGTYRSAAGDKHPQYVSTLSNLGLCFQAAALAKAVSMEKLPFLERAVETFEEVLQLREKVEISYSDNGGSHASTLAQARHHHSLALFYLDMEKNRESNLKLFDKAQRERVIENAIKDTVDYVVSVRDRFKGKSNAEVATALNNLGFIYKCGGMYEESGPCYEEALQLRSKILGPIHPDTIACKYNLAELLRVSGREEDAILLQQEILDELGVEEEEEEGDGGGLVGADGSASDSSRGFGVVGEDFFKDKPMMQ